MFHSAACVAKSRLQKIKENLLIYTDAYFKKIYLDN